MSRPDSSAAPGADSQPIHRPFSWVPSAGADDHDAHFAALTVDVAHGLETCLQLVQSTDMAIHAGTWGDDERPLLSTVDKERLLLLATAAARLLGDRASDRVDRLNERARQETAGSGK